MDLIFIYCIKFTIVTNFFSRIGRKVEYQNGKEGDAHTGDDKVDCVKKRFPSHGYIECDVQVGLVAASIKPLVPHGWNFQDIPFHGHVKLGQVNSNLHYIRVLCFVDVSQVNLVGTK